MRRIHVFSYLLKQRAWIKYAFEILLLMLAAVVMRVIGLRLFRRWTTHLNWKYKHFLIALVERMITPALAIAVVSACFNLFPLSGNLRAGPCVTKLRELEDFHFRIKGGISSKIL